MPRTLTHLAGFLKRHWEALSEVSRRSRRCRALIPETLEARELLASGYVNSPLPDFAEPADNRTFATAWDLGTLNGPAVLEGLSIHSGGADDYFKFRLAASAQLQARVEHFVAINFENAKGDLDLYLYDANGLELRDNAGNTSRSWSSGSNQEYISLERFSARAGTYYLRVAGYRNSVNSYRMTIVPPPPPLQPDRFEFANDNWRTPTNLGLIRRFKGTYNVNIDAAGDVDWYQFQTVATGGATDGIQISFTDRVGDLDIGVWQINANGTYRPLNPSTGVFQDREFVSLSNQTAGNYLIGVWAKDALQTGEYALLIQAPQDVFGADLLEPNNTEQTATPLNRLNTVFFRNDLNISGISDSDWFALTIPNGGVTNQHFAQIDFSLNQGDLRMRLYRLLPNGTRELLEYSSRGNGARRVDFGGRPAGNYLIEVFSYLPNYGATGRYTLTVVPPGARAPAGGPKTGFETSGRPAGEIVARVGSDSRETVGATSRTRSVVVWTETSSSGTSDVNAQLFDATGSRMGNIIPVANTRSDESQPAVAMDAQGNFVVSWTVSGMRQTGSNIRGSQFSADGRRLSTFDVANSRLHEEDSSVAIDGAGEFVIAWVSGKDASRDVLAAMYTQAGRRRQSLTVAATAQAEYGTSVARAADGRFSIAWMAESSTAGQGGFTTVKDISVRTNRYSASGTLLGSALVTDSALLESAPSLAMNESGDTFVVWHQISGVSFDVAGRRLSSSGVLSGVLDIANSDENEWMAAAAWDASVQKFAVTYQVGLTPDTSTVRLVSVSASGSVTAGPVSGAGRSAASLSIDNLGSVLLTLEDARDLRRRSLAVFTSTTAAP